MKFGRLAPYDPQTHPRLYLRQGLRLEQLPSVPSHIDWLTDVPEWPMYLNDQIGDCTCAAAGHMIEAWTAAGQGHAAVISDQDVLIAYEAVSGYVPGDPTTDQGAVMQDVLDYWRHTGIGGHRILAFAQVDHTNLAEVYGALFLFGQVYIGLNVPASAEQQFHNGQPWSVVATDGGILGGHAVNLGWRDGAAMQVITWGRPQGLDEAWWRRYVEEAWIVVDQEWIDNSGHAPQGLDTAALNAAFTSLTGQVGPFPTPVPVPPAPPAPPLPPTPTPPVPDDPDDADRALAAELYSSRWLDRHHLGTARQVAAALRAWAAAKHL